MSHAIADLYTSYRSELCSYLRRKFGAARPEAEDVVHQAFTSLAAMHEPAVVENPRAYLYRASYHILIDERRRLSSWRRGVAPALAGRGVAADELTPERVSIAQERVEILDRVLNRLPHARRRSLLSNRLDGLSCAEIARRDGYSESAVKKHITQAMAELDAALVTTDPPRARSQTRARTIAASILVLIGAAVAYFGTRSSVYTEHYATDVAQLREVALPDGSRMTLGAQTSVDIRFDGDRRRVALNEGEAFFSVTHDADRPFFVAVGKNLVRVVGTQFEVHKGKAEVRVGVLQGVVEVASPPAERASQPVETRVLKAGQGVSGDLNGQLGSTRETGAAAAGAWRAGRRVYIDAPLREIIADINRYSRRPIEIAEPWIGELQVSTSFRVAEPQQILGSLELTLPVSVDREHSGRIVLREKDPQGSGAVADK
jgi:RNA polymerase sigma factor (sigma-70 family)